MVTSDLLNYRVTWPNGQNQGVKNNLGYVLHFLKQYIIHVVTNLHVYKMNLYVLTSLHSKRSRIWAAWKMGREQKGGRKGVGKRKEGNACPQTP